MGYGSGYGKKGLGRYQDMKVQTASPAQIMIMLYDGAIRFSLQAKKKIEAKDFEGKGVFISKTQAIIDELMNSLDFNIAPELCTNLQQLYIYINERLTHANIKMEAEAMNEVIELLNTLRDGWKQALASEQDPTVKKLNDGES
jgi:flagellar secretion chaperone FliS